MIRLLSYLAPSIPAGYFECVAQAIAHHTGEPVDLRFETRISGPMPGDPNPLQAGEADVAFVCAPSYRWQREHLVLLPVPVPVDARAEGRPVYFSDVVVRRDSSLCSLADLQGRRWAFNDGNSLSGWFCLVERIAPLRPDDLFSAVLQSGSHLESLRFVREALADAAAIDSNVLRQARRSDDRGLDDLRVIETWGPYPVQPVVARAGLPPALCASIRDALLRAHEVTGDGLRGFGFPRFVEADPARYD